MVDFKNLLQILDLGEDQEPRYLGVQTRLGKSQVLECMGGIGTINEFDSI